MTDPIDKFLEIGSAGDVLAPLWAFVQDVYYGSPYQIAIRHDCGMSCNQITKQLKAKGVRTWGAMVVGKHITFTVRKPQARYTMYWLHQWGLA